jgi:site-specific DNA-methyltransferase (cytosine-N4-specific)
MTGTTRTSHGGRPQARKWTTGPATLYTGDAGHVLATLPESSVDCIVTSPPYFGLRDYGTGGWRRGRRGCPHTNAPSIAAARRTGTPRTCPNCHAVWVDHQHGLEPTLEAYIDRMVTVFREARRVLRPTGTLWLNIGDCYASAETGRNDAERRYPSFIHGQPPRGARRTGVRTGIPPKNLLGVPWRLALALQSDGWWLRNAIVWAKKNPMPESVTDRLSCTHEMIFLLAPSPRYYFDLDPIRLPLAEPTALTRSRVIGGTGKTGRRRVGSAARRYGATRYGGHGKYDNPDPSLFVSRPPGPNLLNNRPHRAAHPRGKNPGDVWHLSTKPLKEAHFAAFPIDIPLRAIAAGSPPGGVVLDPFSGAATTGLAALQLDRQFVGIELSAEFNRIAKTRLLTQMRQAGADGKATP